MEPVVTPSQQAFNLAELFKTANYLNAAYSEQQLLPAQKSSPYFEEDKHRQQKTFVGVLTAPFRAVCNRMKRMFTSSRSTEDDGDSDVRPAFYQFSMRGHHFFKNSIIDSNIMLLDKWFLVRQIQELRIWLAATFELSERENLEFHGALEELCAYQRQNPIIVRVDIVEQTLDVWSAHFTRALHNIELHRPSKNVKVTIPVLLQPIPAQTVVELMRRGKKQIFEWRTGDVAGIINLTSTTGRDPYGLFPAPLDVDDENQQPSTILSVVDETASSRRTSAVLGPPSMTNSTYAVVPKISTQMVETEQPSVFADDQFESAAKEPSSRLVIRYFEKWLTNQVQLNAPTEKKFSGLKKLPKSLVSSAVRRRESLLKRYDRSDTTENTAQQNILAKIRQLRADIAAALERKRQEALDKATFSAERATADSGNLPSVAAASYVSRDRSTASSSSLNSLISSSSSSSSSTSSSTEGEDDEAQRQQTNVLSLSATNVPHPPPPKPKMFGESKLLVGSTRRSPSGRLLLSSSARLVGSSHSQAASEVQEEVNHVRDRFVRAFNDMKATEEANRLYDPLSQLKNRLVNANTIRFDKDQNDLRVAAEKLLFGVDIKTTGQNGLEKNLLPLRLICDAHKDFWFADYGDADSDESVADEDDEYLDEEEENAAAEKEPSAAEEDEIVVVKIEAENKA